ncbi:hypothetical protein GCM10010910_04110 [Microbacterium nanhaiense]|uniref:Sulfate permease n=2 Tax=Microbacterium nanhaiense TaxID=1301026 RepID=A0ABQ2MXQ9_9MICO|nr:hypothetical protein GCM10010910_04110 [Microbacterium nanhaiense]
MILYLSFRLAGFLQVFFQRCMPTNILINVLRTRRGLKWSMVTWLIAPIYYLLARWFAEIIEAGGSGWVYIVMGIASWDALKMFVAGPTLSVVLLVTKIREAVSITRSEDPSVNPSENPSVYSRRRP